MANGLFGSWDLYGNTRQSVCVCDAENGAVVTLNICNRRTTPAYVSVSITNIPNGTSTDWIEYNACIQPYGVLERSGIVLGQGEYLTVTSDVDKVNVVCWGVASGDTIEVDPIVLNSGQGPVWITESLLPSVYGGIPASISLVTTGSAATYSLISGALPTGMTLNSTSGIISGTPTGPYAVEGSGANNFNFDVSATSAIKTSSRSFNIIRKWYDGSSVSNAAPSASILRTTTGITTDGDYWYKPSGYSDAILCYTNFTNASANKGFVLVARGRESPAWWLEEGQNLSGLNSANLLTNTPIAVAPANFITRLIVSWDRMRMLINRRNSSDSWLHTGKSVNAFAWGYFPQSPSLATSSLVRYNGLWMQSGASNSFNDSQLWSDSLGIGGSNDCTRLFTWTWSGHSANGAQWQGWSGGSSCTPSGSFQVATEGHALQLVNCYVEC